MMAQREAPPTPQPQPYGELRDFMLVVRESPLRSGGRFDLPGAVGLSGALVCVLLAVSKGNEWGWTSAVVVGLLVAAAVLFGVWTAWELRTRAPLRAAPSLMSLFRTRRAPAGQTGW